MCVDKKWGYRFLTVHRGAELLNGVVKLTVCAYRPWIRSNLIEPAGDSKVAATGYSFPSGHWGNLVSRFGMTFTALTLIPYLIMKCAREYQQQTAA